MIVRDYVRNYRTNQEIVKIKEKNGDVQGIATIQLFDAKTGALELEAKTHNIIYQAVYDWLKSYQWDQFCAGAFNKTNTYQGYFNMDNIYLTTSTLPENTPYNLFNYDGLLIGWANKATYSGSDTQRGSPNSAETYANDEKIRWVFDWPTHAANGTFQTIIWSNTLALIRIYGGPIDVGINNGTFYSGFGLTCDGSYLYALSWNGKLYKLTTSGTLINGPINVGINTGTAYSGFGLTCDGSYLYALSWDGKLYKLTTSGTLINGPIDVGINTGNIDSGFGLACDGSYLYALSWNGLLVKNINAYASYFARTLLPSPITKTNQNTMKVIYEFIRS